MKRFWKDERAQDLVEYSLLLGFIALFSVAMCQTVNANILAIWNNVSNLMAAVAA